jgi:hypothetical protein
MAADDVESVDELMGLVIRLSCCGTRRVVVRNASIDVLIRFVLMTDLVRDVEGII